ncbi:MAG TPA: hypothetical protein VGL66_06545 [Caulobacteraceae bacterium]|jgi:hypothetical protein
MSPEAWIALAIGVATLVVNGCTLAVGYGILRGTVNALKERVIALEKQSEAIAGLQALIARIDERTKGTDENLRDLSRRLEWTATIAGFSAPFDADKRKP